MDTTDTQFREYATDLLRGTKCSVTFTKKDGTERDMFCTLAESLIPADKLPKGTDRLISDETRRVFDLEKGEWRSFRWDSVKSIFSNPVEAV